MKGEQRVALSALSMIKTRSTLFELDAERS